MQLFTDPARPADQAKKELEFRVKELEAQVDELQNLYISSTQLLGSLHPEEVLAVVREILLNLVGADGFEIAVRERDGSFTTLAVGEYTPERKPSEDELYAQYRDYVLADGATLFVNIPGLVAIVPLKVGAATEGVLTITHLLEQKKADLTSRDLQLLDFLACHAASALVCASLFQQHARAMGDHLAAMRRAAQRPD
jgi:GAF domain-containing protein